MFKDEALKAIVIVDDETQEVISILNENGDLVLKKGLSFAKLSDEDDMDNIIEERDGKFFFLGFKEDDENE